MSETGGQSVADVIDGLPLDRVLEVHVAGGFECFGYWLDAHSGPCDDELMAILSTTLPRLPNVRAVIFEALPNHLMEMGSEGLRQQLEAIHRIVDESRTMRRERPSRARRRIPPRRRSVVREADWQRRVIDYTTRLSPVPPDDDPGYAVLRELTDKARLGRIAVGARETVLDLGNEIGIAGVQQLADESYLKECSAELWTSAEARFVRTLGGRSHGEVLVGAWKNSRRSRRNRALPFVGSPGTAPLSGLIERNSNHAQVCSTHLRSRADQRIRERPRGVGQDHG